MKAPRTAPSLTRATALVSALLIASALLSDAVALAVQNEIETESITEQGTLDPFSADDRDLLSIFDEAERLFRSAEQPDSVALFDRLIARLESDHAREPLAPELLEMLIKSRAHRAEAYFNLGDTERVIEDFGRILELDPGWRIDPDMVSPKLVEVVDRLRRERVGEIVVLVEPLDATVTVGNRPIETIGQPTSILAGTHPLVIRRPGYSSVEEQVEIRAARSVTVDHVLERLSMVARVRVSPAGASVLVDGEPAQIAQRQVLSETEEELAIDGLAPGRHVLEFRLEEHRPYRYGFEALELGDYQLPPAVLELMQGQIRLAELPEGARVTFDGLSRAVVESDERSATYALPPGGYRVEVRKPGVGGFRTEIALGDQELATVTVALKPTIGFLGVLGSDRLAASDLAKRLTESLGALPEWLWNDHSIDAPAVLDGAALTAAEMRRVHALASRRAAPDWADVQERFDRQFGSSIYLLAVLTDDLYATSAHIWLWSPAPWPAEPSVRTLAIQGGDQALESLVAAFGAAAVPEYPRLGAGFVDAEGVVAATVMRDGAALAAGLAPGDRVLALSGRPLSTVRELRREARRLAGTEVALTIDAEPEPREIRLPVAMAPGVLTLADRSVVDQVVAAQLAPALLRSEPEAPRWLLELNRAAIHLRAMAYMEAVPILRTIQAPADSAFGRPMVDYWLGSALLSLDPASYADAARGALESALANPDARLYHADGPLLAPRARARLAELERLQGR